MKKILRLIICMLFITSIKVNAASFSMNISSGTTSVKAGEEVDVSLSLNNISDIPNGLNACQASLTSSNVSIDSVVGIGWNITTGSVLIMDSSNSVTSNATIATIKATVNAEGSITISNIICSDGENEYNAGSRTINFTIKKEEPTTTTTTTTKKANVPTSTTTKKINDTEKTTTVAKKSSLLKSLNIEGIEIEFDKEIYDYKVEVENNVDKIKLNYEPEDKQSKVEIKGEENLVVGENKIQIVVSNEDSKTTYNLSIIKKDKLNKVNNNEEEILEALKQDIETLKVEVEKEDKNKIITSNILKYLKENKKNIIYEVYDNNVIIYSVKIIGKNIVDTNEINFNIRFNSNYKNTLNEQLKNNTYKIVNFDYRGILPKDTEITIYDLSFTNKVYLYDYNQNKDKLELINEIETTKDIKLDLDKTSEYVLTTYKTSSMPTTYIIIIIILGTLVALLFTIIIFNTIQNKKQKVYNLN